MASFRKLLTYGAFWLWILQSEPASAQRWLVQEKHDGFRIFAESSVGTAEIVRQLMAVRRELDGLLQLPRTDHDVQVIIFDSQQNYRNYLGGRLPEALRRRAIFYKSGELFQIYVWRHSDLTTDLRHEYTHALLHQSLPYIPLWIDEGLAEFMEEQPHLRAASSRQSSMKWRCRTGWKPSLQQLEKIPSAAAMSDEHYRDSWAYVSFLLNDSDQSRALLRSYLQAVSAGEAAGRFSDWTASRDPEVTNRVGSYFRKIRLSLR
ncbi:MAG: hypothetical protein R3C49_04360 [Planctomycetaceae bacterium]